MIAGILKVAWALQALVNFAWACAMLFWAALLAILWIMAGGWPALPLAFIRRALPWLAGAGFGCSLAILLAALLLAALALWPRGK